MTLHPVVAFLDRELRGRDRIQAARRSGAIALMRSAERAGAPFAGAPTEFPTDDDGVPQPLEGWFWSLAHTRGLVCGMVATAPVGIDVEWLERRRWKHTRDYFVEYAPDELVEIGGDDAASVLSLWTAKEAVLKRAGIGLSDLARCPVVARVGEHEFLIQHRGQDVHVRRIFFGQYVLAVAFEESVELELATLPELVA